jgi:hypothetical protein
MGERLPWADDVLTAEASGPLEPGVIYNGGSRQDCSIRKISSLGATLRGSICGEPGREIAVELATGQRPAGTIDWVRGDEAGVRFKQPVDILALINRTLVSQPIERRSMPRVELRCLVHIKCGQLLPAVLRNISALGLQLEGDDLPARGAYVEVFIEGLSVPPGEVVWSKGNLAGVELFEELSWTSIMPWIRETVRNGMS